MWTKEELLKDYHENKAELEAGAENALFLASLLESIGNASDMADPLLETCKGLYRIMDGVSAEFTNSLHYLGQFAELVENDSQKESEREVKADSGSQDTLTGE